MYIFEISDDYPKNFWFQYKTSMVPSLSLKKCKELKIKESLLFKIEKKISVKKLFSFDFYYSDGPDFISPRLANLLSDNKEFLKDVQLIDANIIVNDCIYTGYKVLNILRMISCIDLNKSDSEPIIDYLPDGPKWFNKIVFKQDVIEDFYIASCKESHGHIVMSDKLRQFFIEKNVKGIDLYL